MTDKLEHIRYKIDDVDTQIVKLLSERNELVTAAGKLKKSEEGVRDNKRVDAVLTKIHTLAEREGLDPDIAVRVYKTIIDCFIEKELNQFKGVSRNPPQCNCYFCQQKRKGLM